MVNAVDLKSTAQKACGFESHSGHISMGIPAKKVNQDFFKKWSRSMSYILGYIVADGCITNDRTRKKNPFTFNITSIDKEHLFDIKQALKSEYKLSIKNNGNGGIAYQLQIRNRTLCEDLIRLGVVPRKTHHLQPMRIPRKYFSAFVRGFFDGDGTVYLYKVNGVTQIKAGFVCVRRSFLMDFGHRLCEAISIPIKSIHKNDTHGKMTRYSIAFYIDDCRKLKQFMYMDHPTLLLKRKWNIFKMWETVKRRGYKKQDYPSKVGWHLRDMSKHLQVEKSVVQ